MTMKPCKECKSHISTKAKVCPHCGAKLKRRSGCGTILMIVLGFFLFVFLIGVISGPRNPSNRGSSRQAQSPKYQYTPVTGDLAALHMDSGDEVIVASTSHVLDRLYTLAHAKDHAGFDAMIGSGLAWSLPSGTSCLVIDPGLTTYEVRILEGKYSGRSGFVPREFVHAPKQEALREKPKKWYQGGTLHRSNLGEWAQATFQNRLATSADFVVSMMKSEGKSPTDLTDLRHWAEALQICISENAKAKELHGLSVAEISAACWILMTHSKEDNNASK